MVNTHVLWEFTPAEILREIIQKSYDILLGQIGKGRIIITNEASLQLHFAYILKSIGDLYQFSKDEIITIKLEDNYIATQSLQKSQSKKAKIDIVLELINQLNQSRIACAIELKSFKKENHREPNNRYDVFSDLHNIEEYVYSGSFHFGMLLVHTDHLHYVNQANYSFDTADFDFRHGAKYKAGTELQYRTTKPYGTPISLKNNYDFLWEKSGDFYFLKHFTYRENN